MGFNYKKETVALILAFVIVKLLLGFWLELGIDEAYYTVYARKLEWSYFDHPPAVALLIRFFTLNGMLAKAWAVRLGAIACYTGTAWLVYLTAARYRNAQTGFYACALFSLTFYGGIIGGFFMLPDAPLLLFWAAALYTIVCIHQAPVSSGSGSYYVLIFGLLCGLGFLSKAQAVFLWASLFLYFFRYRRSWLRKGVVYLSVCITVLLMLPVFYWQHLHGDAGIQYHQNRIVLSSIHPEYLVQEWAGEFFYQNPVILVLLIVITIQQLLKKKIHFWDPLSGIFLFASLPLLLVTWGIALFRETLPHWNGPAYLALMILFSSPLARRPGRRFWLLIAAFFFCLVLLGGGLLVNYYPGTIGGKTADPYHYGENDPTLDLYGYRKSLPEVKRVVDSIRQTGTGKIHFLLSDKWFPGGHIDFYLSRPLGIPLQVYGPIEDIHQFQWLNPYQYKPKPGDTALYVGYSNMYHGVPDALTARFQQQGTPILIPQFRSGKLVRYIILVLMIGYKEAAH